MAAADLLVEAADLLVEAAEFVALAAPIKRNTARVGWWRRQTC